MEQAIGSLFAIAILMISGYILAKRGYLNDHAVDGLKRLITELTLPLLLFRAFLLLNPEGRNFILAASIFAACAILGLLGALVSKIAHTPAPETRLLFQGFEAGMLGYALFSGYHGNDNLQYFAALDMGQVLYVFTVLMAQMSGSRSGFPWRDIAKSKVLWAIVAGLLISRIAPQMAERIATQNKIARALFDTVGGLTTPLVCIVIGASLSAGFLANRNVIRTVVLRLIATSILGIVIAYVVIPALGFSPLYAHAAMVLFLLPPPFVIPVYYKQNAQFVSSILTLSTIVSVIMIAVLALLGVA